MKMYYVDDIEERIRDGKVDAKTLKKDLKIVEKYSNCVASTHFFLDLKSTVGEPEKHHVLFTNLGDFRDVFSLYELVLFRRDLLKMRLFLSDGIVKDVVDFFNSHLLFTRQQKMDSNGKVTSNRRMEFLY